MQTNDNSVTPPETEVIEQPTNPIGIFFSSMASGPASDTFLKEWFTGYIQKNNLKVVSADKYAGCGKEGEYIIVIRLGKETSNSLLQFRKTLETVVNKQVAINKIENSSAGPIHIEYAVKEDSYSYCRLGKKNWL